MSLSMAPALSSSLCSTPQKSSIIPFLPSFQTSISLQFNFKFRKPISRFKQKNTITLTAITCLKSGSKYAAEETNSSFAVTAPSLAESNGQRNWIVVVKAPPSQQAVSKPDVIDYYVKILERVLGRWVCSIPSFEQGPFSFWLWIGFKIDVASINFPDGMLCIAFVNQFKFDFLETTLDIKIQRLSHSVSLFLFLFIYWIK